MIPFDRTDLLATGIKVYLRLEDQLSFIGRMRLRLSMAIAFVAYKLFPAAPEDVMEAAEPALISEFMGMMSGGGSSGSPIADIMNESMFGQEDGDGGDVGGDATAVFDLGTGERVDVDTSGVDMTPPWEQDSESDESDADDESDDEVSEE